MTETNNKLALIFLNLARMLGMEDEKKNKFRIIAYQNAARILQNMNEDIASVVEGDSLPKISGIGTAIQEKIVSYLHTGHIPMYDVWLEIYPESFLEIFRIPHIGPKTAKVLYDHFNVRSISDLEKIIESHVLENHPGFGEKSVQNIREALTRIKKESKRLPLSTVYPTVDALLKYMKMDTACEQIVFAGSLRRFEDTIGDIDLLATSHQAEHLIEHFVNFPEKQVIQAQGDTKASIIVTNNLQVDLRVVEPDSFGAALQYFTGSKDHNVHLRNIAKDHGLKLNEYGVFKGEENIASKKEEDIYAALGISYVPPELRRNQGEIEEAMRGPFPAFITLQALHHNTPIAHEKLTKIEAKDWENYPVLLNQLHEISTSKKVPLILIHTHIPAFGTWQMLQKNCEHFAIQFIDVQPADAWKKEVAIGLMRRARVKEKQVFLA